MEEITVHGSRTYRVLTGDGLLEESGRLLGEVLAPPRRLCIVTDNNVDKLYGIRVQQTLTSAGYMAERYVFPAGESSKTMETVSKIVEYLAQNAYTRKDALVALGGGVVGDITGFCAAIYLRGVQVVQLPTTMLAAIDSSIGGKTGVNLRGGKNLAGSIWQPSLVLCDSQTLATLSAAEIADGMAEAVKYGMLEGEGLFTRLEKINGGVLPAEIISLCVACKGKLVERDERDEGLRQKLNLGHTLGHGAERASGYRITHGHGVAMGMAHITRSAVRLGYCSPEVEKRLEQTLLRHHLPVDIPFPAQELIDAAARDKKRRGQRITLVVPCGIGDCRLMEVTWDDFEQWVRLGYREQ